MIKLTPDIAESATIYASALDEIGGKGLAELLITDDEDPKALKAFAGLKGTRRDEVFSHLGWFRGVADVLCCEPVEVLRLGRSQGRKLEVVK